MRGIQELQPERPEGSWSLLLMLILYLPGFFKQKLTVSIKISISHIDGAVCFCFVRSDGRPGL